MRRGGNRPAWFPFRNKPTYRPGGYQRPLLQRLTPVTWYIIVLVVVALITGVSVAVARTAATQNGTELLTDRLAANPLPTPTTIRVMVASPAATRTAVPKPPTVQPTVILTPTEDPNQAPWASQISKQPDGTLQAPQAVVAKAMADLGAYYALQRDLSLDDFLSRRNDILATYFTGTALAEMRMTESQRKQYGMNRAGWYSVEVQHFSTDGWTAKAGVITRSWVNDIYDVQTKKLVVKGKLVHDTLTIMTITYDRSSGRWKFATVDEIVELSQ